jgi:hypothetical protein
VLRSCFFRGLAPFFVDSFTGAFRRRPALSTPQAFCVSEELPANFAKLMAAFRSRSITSPHCWQWKVRSESIRFASYQPQPEHVREDGSHRSASTMRHPFQAALYVNCRRNSYQPTSPIACARR